MTNSQITADVDRGLAIAAEMDTLKAELKGIETRLSEAALTGVTIPLQDETREGRQFLAEGTGVTIPVIIESDQILGSFPAASPTHRILATLCGEHLPDLFKEVHKYERAPKDGNAFRKELASHFEPVLATEILAATLQRDKNGIPKSRIIISWDRPK